MNPFRGLTLKRGWHWFWLLNVILSVPILLVCLAGLFVGGWFVGLLWLLWMSEIMPQEVQDANSDHSVKKGRYPAKETVYEPTPLDVWYQERGRHWP